jgi:drug/metabolite transporter (DMT)-like permease
MKTESFKGYTFALVATIAYSNVYIFSKAALNEIHLSQFGFFWYAISSVLCLGFAFWNKKLSLLKTLGKKQILIFILLGFLEITTTTLFFLSINIISDPSVTSFLGNMYPVMVTLGGIFILKEKFGWVEIVGISLALAGAFIISYSGGTTLKTLFIKGTEIVLLNAVFATIATLVVKVNVKSLSPELLNLNRSLWLFVYSAIMVFVFGKSFSIPAGPLKDTAIGASLEFLAILTVYYSFKYIEASRSSIVQSLKGIFVLIVAFAYFGTFPLPYQLFGGFLTVTGVLLMALAQAGIFRKKPTATPEAM